MTDEQAAAIIQRLDHLIAMQAAQPKLPPRLPSFDGLMRPLIVFILIGACIYLAVIVGREIPQLLGGLTAGGVAWLWKDRSDEKLTDRIVGAVTTPYAPPVYQPPITPLMPPSGPPLMPPSGGQS